MPNEEAREVLQKQIDIYGQEYDVEGIEALKKAIKMLELQPCEDTISRQAVLDNAYAYGNGLEPEGYCVNVEDIQALPSVTPQQQSVTDFADKCKECGKILNDKLQISWIPVSEKLPNRGDTVIATFKSPVTGMPFVATTHIVREPKEVVKDSNIIAWMPIMKPYKEK